MLTKLFHLSPCLETEDHQKFSHARQNKTLTPPDTKSPRELVLGGNALNTVESVQILVENNLVASSTTLARNDARVGKEEFPDAKPSASILGLNLLAVGHPVSVPPPECSAVVDYKTHQLGFDHNAG